MVGWRRESVEASSLRVDVDVDGWRGLDVVGEGRVVQAIPVLWRDGGTQNDRRLVL